MYRPGAETSGLANPSAVYPYDDHGGLKSSARETVSLISTAPTVMTNGSLPGEYTIACGPLFPDDVTTTMPLSHNRRTAASSGSANAGAGEALDSEKLATLML